MKTEVEAKFLDIDADVIRGKLKVLGAILVYPECMVRQKLLIRIKRKGPARYSVCGAFRVGARVDVLWVSNIRIRCNPLVSECP